MAELTYMYTIPMIDSQAKEYKELIRLMIGDDSVVGTYKDWTRGSSCQRRQLYGEFPIYFLRAQLPTDRFLE